MNFYKILLSLFLVLGLSLGGMHPCDTFGASHDSETPLISGSFLQGWMCRDWSQERWNQELAAMKSLGMKTLILQSSYDWATTASVSSEYGQDWSKYTTTSRYSLYPTEIPELKGANNSMDQLKQALAAAKENDMTIYIGLVSDDRWWKFGWGIPTAASSNADLATESYFAQWCAYNGEVSAKMITEIWNRYSSDYAEQIGGWYYNNEIWNFDSACAGTDNGVYSQILADNFNTYLKAIEQNCPDKPLMLSPYFNRTLSTGTQYCNFWKSVFAKTNFKLGDIFAPQDCIGEHPDKIDTAPEWIGKLAEAAKTKEGLRFWVNNETFTASYSSASVDRVISQIEATRQYAETHILFSWNHYYNPIYNSAFQSYNDQLAAYIEEQKTPPVSNKIDGGIEINGFQISTNIQGFRTIYSVENKIDGKDVVGCGLIYSLSDYVTGDEICMESENVYVKSCAGTIDLGQHANQFSNSETAASFAMTMRFAEKTSAEFQTKYSIKAYALLSDGTYAYSDVEEFTIFDVAGELYNNSMMNHYDAHNYLYTNILKIVDANYKEKEFVWKNTVAKQ